MWLFFFGLLLLFLFRPSFLRFIFGREYGRRDASDPWIAVPARPGQVRLLFTRWCVLILLHLHHIVKRVLVELDLSLLSEVNSLLIRLLQLMIVLFLLSRWFRLRDSCIKDTGAEASTAIR